MTCIVGIEHKDGVTIGVDSLSSDGLSKNVRANGKLFLNGACLFGFTSSWRMGQLLQYGLRLDVGPPRGDELDGWMCTTFVDKVRATLKAGGFATMKDSAEAGGTFMVGLRGRLYTVYDDYQVSRSAEGYDAVGSGARVALGALHATAALGGVLDPWQRCNAALEAAAQHTTSVGGPFHIDTMQ